MNIFVLHSSPRIAAQYHCDKHVVKMILETAQILSSVHWLCDKNCANNARCLYKLTHKNHPCCVWARDSSMNYSWLSALGINLCYEYTHRYKKIHKTQEKMVWLYHNIPIIKDDPGRTPFVLAMPMEYRCDDPVLSYQSYYKHEKSHILKYTNREVPDFLL